MNKQHPLTYEIILNLIKHVDKTTDWNDCDEYPSSLYTRAAADWQLEQVIKFMEEHEQMFGGSGMIFILKKAMRPQQQEDN